MPIFDGSPHHLARSGHGIRTILSASSHAASEETKKQEAMVRTHKEVHSEANDCEDAKVDSQDCEAQEDIHHISTKEGTDWVYRLTHQSPQHDLSTYVYQWLPHSAD